MKKSYLVVISIIGIFVIIVSGFLYYEQAYTQNCESGGGNMTGVLRCTKILDGDFVSERETSGENDMVNIVIPTGASNPEAQKNYVPKNILVVIGVNNTVTWVNEDDASSSVVSDDDLFDSGLISPKNAWTHTFDMEGFYGYHSEPHPWMKGMVIVELLNNEKRVNSTSSREITVLSISPENVTLPELKPKTPAKHDGLIQE
ncbi:MAG: hypothetical protein EPO62_06105 [Candidatus Nitrosotenuis sp.]|nr:MAG: hypothetical protein EPO62_06105 [Candidatus Nitrosotenuis sp.]